MPEPAPLSLNVKLGDWRCRLAAETEDGAAGLQRFFGDLAAGACSPPSTLTLRAGSPSEIQWSQEGHPGDFTPLFAGPEGKRFREVPHAHRRLFADSTAGSEAALELQGDTLRILRPDSWPLYFSHVLTWLMLREQPVVAVHAAVCAVWGTALLLIGSSGCGKSTLAYALACLGADYYTDEAAFFTRDRSRLFVWPQRLGLRPGGMAALAAPPPDAAWFESKPDDMKCLPVLPRPRRTCPEHHSFLLFVEGFGEQPVLAPIPGGEAARRLAFVMGYGDPSPLARLEAAADVVSRLPCRTLTIGRPEETAALLITSAQEKAECRKL